MEGNLFNIISLFLAVISLAAIVLSIIAYRQSTKAALKVSSKEHEMSENLKYDILQLIAVLNAIDEKARLKTLRGKIDYSHEIEILLRLQSHPEFLLLIRSIKESPYRNVLEHDMHQLTDGSLDDDKKRENAFFILTAIKKQVNIDALVKQIEDNFSNNWNQTVKELCDLSSHSDSYGYTIVNNWIKYGFFDYLIKEKNINDNDLEAIVNGPIVVDPIIKSITENKLIFSKYYTEFCDYYDCLLSSFVVYLVETKQIEDIEIRGLYSTIKREGKCHQHPSNDEYDLTHLRLFVKYLDEYEDFRKHQKK